MGQILNGRSVTLYADGIADDVAVLRKATGNYDFTVDTGAQGAYTIFAVTGDVYLQIAGLCETSLTSDGAATVELGIAGNTAALIAQTTATDLDQYETWQDATPEANPGAITLEIKSFFLANGEDIILTIAGADLTAGTIRFTCSWWPITASGRVVAV
jgi:hypothetical protein